MNKTKDIQKKRIIYIGETVFCLLIAILWLVSLSQDILNKVDWADVLKDFIWLIILELLLGTTFIKLKLLEQLNLKMMLMMNVISILK